MRRTIAILLLAAAAVCMAAGCTGQSSSATQGGASGAQAAPPAAPSAGSAPQSAPAAEGLPYEVQPITQQRYEHGGSAIVFNDLPENDAETIVCNSYLFEITGERQKDYALWLHHDDQTPPTSEVEANYEVVLEWVHINNVQELTLEEVRQREEYGELFHYWYESVGSELSYDDYVAALFDAGCRMVLVEDENRYFDYVYERGPQLSDGEHAILWLLAPDAADGELKLFANTRFYWSLFLSANPDAWPAFVMH